MKAVKNGRFMVGLVGVAAVVTYLIWTGVSETMVYYLTPVELMAKVAPVAAVTAGGPSSIVVSGATVSTVNPRVAGVGSGVPDGSMARTATVCAPSARSVRSSGELHPANPASFNGVVRQAKSAGIPVVATGSPIVASEIEADAAASSSHCEIGHELAKGAMKLLPDGGDIAVLAGPPGAFWASDRLRCFKEDIEGTNINIVAEQTSEQDAAVALSLANDFLQRFPDIDLLYGADDTYGIGIARAAQGAGKCGGKVKVLFAVLGEAAEEMMRADCADYVVAQQPVLIGRLGVQLADKLINDQPIEEKFISVPLIPVTPENLDTIDKTSMQAPKGWTP